jgi:type II restriction enzyme
MAVNRDKPGRWKADVARSVDMYNDWFMKFAPKAFRETRVQTTRDVEATLCSTGNLTNIRPATIREHPEILPTLRMSTCPPLAVDRLIGLAGVSSTLVKCMELERKKRGRESFIDLRWQLGYKNTCRVVRASLPVALPIMS